MTSFARYKPIYASLFTSNVYWDSDKNKSTFGQAVVDTLSEATINETYDIPVVERASNYLVSVERLELSLNAIPFYSVDDGPEEILLRSKIDTTKVNSILLNENAYSLTHLFQILMDLEWPNPNDDTGDSKINPIFNIDESGFINITVEGDLNFNQFQFEFPRRLSCILGISTDIQYTTEDEEDALQTVTSLYPRCDLGDQLDHILITSNLPTYTDQLGNAKQNVLTDFAVPSSGGASVSYTNTGLMLPSSYQNNIRQKLIYIPSERRYLDLNGDFPINNITVSAMYVDYAHNLRKVTLPIGGIFEIKLGFYLKQ